METACELRASLRVGAGSGARESGGESMASVVRNWGEILRTQNLSPDERIDTVSRCLLVTRASVVSMTVTSSAVGGILAIRAPETSWICFSPTPSAT